MTRPPRGVPHGGTADAAPTEFRRFGGDYRRRQLLDLRGLEDTRGGVQRRILKVLTGRKNGKRRGRGLVRDLRDGNYRMGETPGKGGRVGQGDIRSHGRWGFRACSLQRVGVVLRHICWAGSRI